MKRTSDTNLAEKLFDFLIAEQTYFYLFQMTRVNS